MKRIAAIITIAILFVALSSLVAYKNYLRVEADNEDRFNTAQLVLARHTAHSVEGLAEGIKREMMIASLLPSIQKGANGCLTRMQEIYKGLKGDIIYLYRLDEKGRVTHVVPQGRMREVEERRPDSKPLITAPLSDRGMPAGVIGAEIDLSSLVGREMRPGMLLTGENGYAWAIDDQGRFIFHPEDEFVGRDAFSVRKERAPHVSFDEIDRIMREKMIKGESGSDAYVSGWHREERGKVKKLIAYAPFHIGAGQYSLAFVTPASEVASLIRENFRNTLTIMAVITALMLFGLLFVLYIDRRRIEALERGAGLAKEIKESRDYLQNLLETINDFIYTVDINGNFTYLNPGIEDYGYRADECLGKHFLTILTEKHHGERFEKTVREKVRQTYEVELKTKEGAVRICRISASPLVDKGGGVTGLLATVRDITEREQAKAEIIYLKEYNEKIVASIPSSLLVLDRNLNIKSVNWTYRETRGIKDEDVVGKNIKEVFPDQLLKDGGLLQAFEAVLATKEPRSLYEVKHASSDHPEKILNITVSGLRRAEEEEEEELILVIEDVTERARLQEEIRKKNEELENFVYIVSHDLKSPIVSMQGFSSMLLNEYREKLGEEGGRYLDRIRANASRMEVLISDLLALSRVGRVVGAFKDVSSLDIVNRVCNGLKSRIEEKRIEVSITDDLPIIHCDADRIYQVFENLVVNAVKFTGDTEKPKIEIGYEERGESHCFYVRDNGIGIDPEYHGKIFEIFQRLKEIEDEEGTGIGLVIVERIVKNHGGRVWVESEKGKGATFYFTLEKMPS